MRMKSEAGNGKTKHSGVAGKLSKGDKVLDSSYNKTRASKVENEFLKSVLIRSVLAIIIVSVIMFVVVIVMNRVWPAEDYLNNLFCNVLAMVFIVAFVDTIVTSNGEGRRKRDEARAILRHNRIIQPDIDMYLVRKNMVITPNGTAVRKFQVESDFKVSDMRDMYGASELVSDVGISKINRYAHYQLQLKRDFEHLVQGVDFTNYPEISEVCMKFINATSYGEAALEAVVGYEDARAGTRSMRTMVVGMIKDEPDNGRFMDANPTMKNVYLVHQMIMEQQSAVAEYIRLIRVLAEKEPTEARLLNQDYERSPYRSPHAVREPVGIEVVQPEVGPLEGLGQPDCVVEPQVSEPGIDDDPPHLRYLQPLGDPQGLLLGVRALPERHVPAPVGYQDDVARLPLMGAGVGGHELAHGDQGVGQRGLPPGRKLLQLPVAVLHGPGRREYELGGVPPEGHHPDPVPLDVAVAEHGEDRAFDRRHPPSRSKGPAGIDQEQYGASGAPLADLLPDVLGLDRYRQPAVVPGALIGRRGPYGSIEGQVVGFPVGDPAAAVAARGVRALGHGPAPLPAGCAEYPDVPVAQIVDDSELLPDLEDHVLQHLLEILHVRGLWRLPLPVFPILRFLVPRCVIVPLRLVRLLAFIVILLLRGLRRRGGRLLERVAAMRQANHGGLLHILLDDLVPAVERGEGHGGVDHGEVPAEPVCADLRGQLDCDRQEVVGYADQGQEPAGP